MSRRRGGITALAVALVLLATGCSQPEASRAESITLYTCVNDTTVQPVIAAFKAAHQGTDVQLFRAPTGQLAPAWQATYAPGTQGGRDLGLRSAHHAGLRDPGLVGGWTPQTEIPGQCVRPTTSASQCSTWWRSPGRASQPRRTGKTLPTPARSPTRPEGGGVRARGSRLFRHRLLRRSQIKRRGPGEYTGRRDHRCRPGSLRRWNDDRQFGVRRSKERLAGGRVLAEAGRGSDLRAGRGIQDHRESPTGPGLATYLTSPEGQTVIGSSGLLSDVAGCRRPDQAGHLGNGSAGLAGAGQREACAAEGLRNNLRRVVIGQ